LSHPLTDLWHLILDAFSMLSRAEEGTPWQDLVEDAFFFVDISTEEGESWLVDGSDLILFTPNSKLFLTSLY